MAVADALMVARLATLVWKCCSKAGSGHPEEPCT